MTRFRMLFALLLICVATTAIYVCYRPAPLYARNQPTQPPKHYRNIAWSELIPAGWDPAQPLRGLDVNALQDSDPRAQAALEKARAIWDTAPGNPALNGQAVRIAGYVVPLDAEREAVHELLLVPYFGACIHTPPPPANQIIHVRLRQPQEGIRPMDTLWIKGTLRLENSSTEVGIGLSTASYWLDADQTEPYSKSPG